MTPRIPQPAAALLLALFAAAAWTAWLGWDQRYDELPDGSVSGPYQAWQVIGLVLTLLPAVLWAALRQYPAAGVLGVSGGLATAAWVDWSGGDGLFVIGVGMVAIGSLASTAVLTGVTQAVRS
ncbi:hypothetical protein [Kitasatospora sp. NPDC004289]